MNTNQTANLISSIIQLAMGALVTKGLITGTDAESIGGAIVALITFAISHNWHSTPPAAPTSSSSKVGILVALGLCGALLFGSVGCSTTPQAAAYQAAGTTALTVEQAVQAYDAWAKAGKTSVAQNQQVAAAYAKYQAAMALVCDAGSAYASVSSTNSTGQSQVNASASLQQAVTEANQSLTDLENLIVSFGVKL